MEYPVEENGQSEQEYYYNLNLLLPTALQRLFSYGKQFTAPNTIAVFVVEQISISYLGSSFNYDGVAFPPRYFHQVADYPQRNSVLLLGRYPTPGSLPDVRNVTLGHEITHMLLNRGGHQGASDNLLQAGRDLTLEQCNTLLEVNSRLYGEEEIPDPGPPE